MFAVKRRIGSVGTFLGLLAAIAGLVFATGISQDRAAGMLIADGQALQIMRS